MHLCSACNRHATNALDDDDDDGDDDKIMAQHLHSNEYDDVSPHTLVITVSDVILITKKFTIHMNSSFMHVSAFL